MIFPKKKKSQRRKKNQRSKLEPLTLTISGKGSTFIENLLYEIDLNNRQINYQKSSVNALNESKDHKISYMLLLNKLNINSDWVKNAHQNNSGQSQWQITSECASLELRNWLIEERERLIQQEIEEQKQNNLLVKSLEPRYKTFLIPTAHNIKIKNWLITTRERLIQQEIKAQEQNSQAATKSLAKTYPLRELPPRISDDFDESIRKKLIQQEIKAQEQNSQAATKSPEKTYPLRGSPITISDDFDEPMSELWEELGK